MLKLLQSLIGWTITWLYYVCVVCFLGALLGGATHILFGLLFMAQPDYAYLASFGFMNGLKYGSLWAGGLSIVLCVMRARKACLGRCGAGALEGPEG